MSRIRNNVSWASDLLHGAPRWNEDLAEEREESCPALPRCCSPCRPPLPRPPQRSRPARHQDRPDHPDTTKRTIKIIANFFFFSRVSVRYVLCISKCCNIWSLNFMAKQVSGAKKQLGTITFASFMLS